MKLTGREKDPIKNERDKQELIDKISGILDYFLKNKNSRTWRITMMAFAVVIVFITTYGLILPAITIEKKTAQKMPGVNLTADAGRDEEERTSGEKYKEKRDEDQDTLQGSGDRSNRDGYGEETGSEKDGAGEKSDGTGKTDDEQGDAAGKAGDTQSDDSGKADDEQGDAVGKAGDIQSDNSGKADDDQGVAADKTDDEQGDDAGKAGNAQSDKKADHSEREYMTEPLTWKTLHYGITMSFDRDALIPKGTRLKVEPVIKGSADYKIYEEALKKKNDKLTGKTYYRFKLVKDGKELRPKMPVEVTFNKRLRHSYKEERAVLFREGKRGFKKDLRVKLVEADSPKTGAKSGTDASADKEEKDKADESSKSDKSAGADKSDRSYNSNDVDFEDEADPGDSSDSTEMAEEGDQIILSNVPFHKQDVLPVIGLVCEDGSGSALSENADINLPELSDEYPAVSFKASTGDLDISVEADEGSLPDGTVMRVSKISLKDALDAVADTVENDESGREEKRKVRKIQAADITFTDKEGNEIEPLKPIRVTMTSKLVGQAAKNEDQEVAAVHLDDKGRGSLIDISEEKKKEEISFDADDFSVYALVQYEFKMTDAQIMRTELSASGENYEISVAYGEDAKIPEGAKLKVKEILPEDEGYADYYDESAGKALKDAKKRGVDTPLVTGARFFDIEIRGNKGKIEPEAPVEVNIGLVGKEEAKLLSVVHFGDEGTETMILTESSSSAEEGKNDQDSGDGKKDGEDLKEVQFETQSFSVYTVVSVDSAANLAADNKQYALVVADRGPNIGSADEGNPQSITNYALTAANVERAQNSNGIQTTLAGKGVNLNGNLVGGNVPLWGFEDAGDGKYYIYTIIDGNKKYITSNYENYELTDEPHDPYTIEIENNRVRFKYNVPNYGDFYLTNGGDNPSCFYLSNNADNTSAWGNVNTTPWFTLAELDPNYEEKTAKKVSAADWKSGNDTTQWNENDTVVIYRRIEHADGSEELYALATDGSLIPVYDGGDSIYYHCPTDKNVNWHVALGATGYYISNVIPQGSSEPTVYLAPSVTNGTWSSDSPVGLVLEGMGSSYGTTIENWDQAAYAYAGLHVDATNSNTLSQGVTPGSDVTSDTFLFAVSDTLISQGELHTVNTVDSTEKGITMKIFNYGGDTYHYGYRNQSMQDVMGDDMTTDWDNRKSHVTKTVEGKLGEDGFPVSLSNGNSYAPLFTMGDGSIAESGGDANNLFLQSYYDENGMFRYSSMENFAHYNSDTGDFTVYRETGTPNIPTQNDHYYYYHGHFMPYNNLDDTVSVSRIVDQYGSITDKEMGRSYEDVYGLSESPDYYVGMSLEAKFVQPSDGILENGDPVVYRFTGDDDLLVYIDGILVLDVGGIHEPLTGSINFETGVVTQPNFYGEGDGWQTHTTTLYEIFRTAYMNGLISNADWAKMKWVDSDENGEYDTFADHTTHSFNMFYMERGAGASNLDLQFNLQVVKKDEFTVRKSLPAGVKTEFVNRLFRFKAYFIDDTETDPANQKKLLYPGVKKADGSDVCTKVLYADLKDANGRPVEKNVPFAQDHSFTLRAGEAAVFSMANEEIIYDVYEVDINGDLIRQVDINGDSTQIESGDQSAEVHAGEESVEDRSEVNVTNHPVTENLRVTKHITEDSMTGWENGNPVFEFRVYLEQFVTDENGNLVIDNVSGKPKTKLVPYARSPYYLVKIPEGQENNEEAWEYYTLTGDNNAPVPQPRGTVCSITGRSGTINSIPPEYTIIIPDIAAGTHFYVEERRVTIPEGYEFDHEKLKDGTYDSSELGTGDIEQILTIDQYSNDEEMYFDEDSVGRIKAGKDAEFDVWNRKPAVEIPVEKVWEDNGQSGRPDNVTLALVRYMPQMKYTPEHGKGAIIINHTADYGENNPSTELPHGFVATYAIERFNSQTNEYEVIATGTSGPFDVDPGDYRISTVVNNRGSEPANYTYNKTDPVMVTVHENQSTIAHVTSEYNYEQGGQITITHIASYEGGEVTGTDLPEGFSATYTIKDEASNRIVHRNVTAGTYEVPAGTYTVTANVSDAGSPENYVYESTPPVNHVTVASGGHESTELISQYVYVAPKTYGYITIDHKSSGLNGVSPDLPEGIQVASYRIVGPTTINNAQLGREYQVEAGEYTVIANINYASGAEGYIYAGTENQEIVIGTDDHKSVTLTSAYVKQGELVINHSFEGLPEGTRPENFSVQYSIINAAGETIKSHVGAGSYPVPAGDYIVQVYVYGPGTTPEGYFYVNTPETVSVSVPSEGTGTANVVSTYGANGTITIEHKSNGLAGSPDELPSGFGARYLITYADTGEAVPGLEAGMNLGQTYSVPPGNYVIKTVIDAQNPPIGYSYADNPDTTDIDEGTPAVNVTIESGEEKRVTVISHYNPPSYLTYTLSGTWKDKNGNTLPEDQWPTNGSVTVPIIDAWSNQVGTFTLSPENNWTGTVSLMSGGGHGSYRINGQSKQITGNGIESVTFDETSLSDSEAGTFTYNGVVKPTTATVYLCIDYSQNISETHIEVPKNSSVKLVYSNATIDHGSWTETVTPTWKLYGQNGGSWNEISGTGGNAPGDNGEMVPISDEYDVYCILINTAPGNAQYLNASITAAGSGSTGGHLLNAAEPSGGHPLNAMALSGSGMENDLSVAKGYSTRLMLPKTGTVVRKTGNDSKKTSGSAASNMRATPAVTDADPSTITIPASVVDSISTLNQSLAAEQAGYEYVLDSSFGKQVILSDPWSYIFEGLEEVGEGGHPYYYALVEVEVPDHYDVSYGSNPVSAFDIRANMEARANALEHGETLPDLLSLTSVNTKNKGSLNITKTIRVNGGQAEQNQFPSGTYSYPVQISTVIEGRTYYVQDTNGSLGTSAPAVPLTVTAGPLDQAGDALTIQNLPFGTYTVTEIGPESVEVTGYSFVVKETGPGGDVHFESVLSGEGTVEDYTTPGSVSLVNYYMKGASWTPEVDKWLNGIPHFGSAEGYSGYTFTIAESAEQNTIKGPGTNNHTMTATTGADGSAVFKKIDYGPQSVPGNQNSKDYYYTITENRPAAAQEQPYIAGSVSYDTKTIYVKVTVSKSGEGHNRVMSAQARYYSDSAYEQPLSAVAFDNTELGTLTVKKIVTGSYQATAEDRFPFTVMKDGQYVTATADISGTTYTYTGMSDTDPGYTIQAGQTLTFKDLPAGTYVVTEGSVSKNGYLVTITYTVNSESAATGTAVVQKDQTSAVEITNNYAVSGADLMLIKMDANGMETPLKGATFTICPIDETAPTISETGQAVTGETTGKDGVETGEDGKVVFSDLANGYYIVRETKVPKGYIRTDEGYFFIRVEAGVAKLVERDGSGWKERPDSNTLIYMPATPNHPAGYKVGNTPGAALPSTGGEGTTLFSLLGFVLTGIAASGMMMRKKRIRA